MQSPPREITPTIRRRSWGQSPVRIWLVLALAVGAVAMYYFVLQTYRWSIDRRLIEEGVLVQAKIIEVVGISVTPGQAVDTQYTLAFEYELDGQKRVFHDQLRDFPASRHLVIGEEFPIRIDKADSSIWTWRTDPPSLGQSLQIELFLVPLLMFSILMAWIMRRGILKLWRDGDTLEAVVIETSQSGTAPMSMVIRCTPVEESDQRVFSVLYPRRAGKLTRGDRLMVVAKGSRAVAVKALTPSPSGRGSG